ncbi:MAG TPA: phosphatidate cytidylyltransferase [Parvularculaceae bacterium]|nr:phosphatidate cytidylyltransferase [Parvularculaceae bacterium]
MTTIEKSERPTAPKGSLARRIVSALVLIPAAIAALYAGGAVFAATVSFASVLMVFEWTRMVEEREFSPAFYALALAAAAALSAAAAGHYPWAYGACGAGALAAGMMSRRRRRWSAFAGAYILAPSVALIWLRADPESGRSLVLMLLLIVWGADTGGYVAGRLVGGPKLHPAVSPTKTWAGAIGGVVMGGLAGLAASLFIFQSSGTGFLTLVGAILGLASILGDTAESAFKRIFGVKDASGFIPGHGGVLDRLDGMIFATTAMALVLYLHIVLGR